MKYLTTAELAARWKLHEQTLRNWRNRGNGPKYVKLGNKCLYAIVEVEAWEQKNEKRSTVG